METSRPRVLVLRIEPASYMLALVKALRATWAGRIDVIFASPALTQKWELGRDCLEHEMLPKGRLNAMRAIRRMIQDTQPDLLHVAGWSAPPSLAAILAGRACGLPVIVDLDTWRGTPSRWRGAVKRLIYPFLLQQVAHFAPGGKRQAAYLGRFGVPDEKITPVGMTVDVTAIRSFAADESDAGEVFRRRFGIATDATMVLYIGRLVPLKGLDDLLAAWPQVATQVPNARLVIAGDGELRERISAAAQLDTSICPVDRLSGDDVWRAYLAADFVVVPSHFENWGLVVNEAMAAGKPIIVTDVFGCVGDLAHDDQTALVVPPHAPARLGDAMTRLAREPETRRRLATAAGALISDWTIEHEAERIVGIWRRALETDALA